MRTTVTLLIKGVYVWHVCQYATPVQHWHM